MKEATSEEWLFGTIEFPQATQDESENTKHERYNRAPTAPWFIHPTTRDGDEERGHGGNKEAAA